MLMSKFSNAEIVPLVTRSTHEDRLKVKDVVGHDLNFYACVILQLCFSPINQLHYLSVSPLSLSTRSGVQFLRQSITLAMIVESAECMGHPLTPRMHCMSRVVKTETVVPSSGGVAKC